LCRPAAAPSQIYGEHGRELISAESGLSFLRRIRALETFAESGKPTGYDQNVVVKTKFFELVGTDKELVDMLGHVKITLLPMENPNGRDIVEVRALQNCAASMFWLIVAFIFVSSTQMPHE